MRTEAAVWGGLGAWLTAVAVGFGLFHGYDATPGPAAAAASNESAGTGSWQVVLYAHPHCPCTRASLAELAEIVARGPHGMVTEVVFVRPPGTPPGWERGTNWGAAGRLTGVNVRLDEGGVEARRAGAAASGLTVVTDPTGAVVYRGGISPARGRPGDNPGRRAVLAALRGEPAGPPAPVYGCPLFDD
ncbi:MAG: hypothetical protein K2X82_33845 [Gemmataceae bacterium]|nr:hypothetical protein [Gemmataceae bacterium]